MGSEVFSTSVGLKAYLNINQKFSEVPSSNNISEPVTPGLHKTGQGTFTLLCEVPFTTEALSSFLIISVSIIKSE